MKSPIIEAKAVRKRVSDQEISVLTTYVWMQMFKLEGVPRLCDHRLLTPSSKEMDGMLNVRHCGVLHRAQKTSLFDFDIKLSFLTFFISRC